MSAPETFPVRNVRFALDDTVPRDWHGGRRSVTAFFDNLSLFFPPGERFFVASVKRHLHLVQDETLLAEVKAFCGQEGFHSREHVRYNRMLESHGYPAIALEARIERILRFLTRVLPARARLAATCALEHFTATLAHSLLADPAVLDGAHPVMAALWKWHAAEENEHKAVAFDVYLKAGGSWFQRARIMLGATLIFSTLIAYHQVRLMKRAGMLLSVREWSALWWFLWFRPGPMRKTLRLYLSYYRPGFHPWQFDNRDLLEKWKREQATSQFGAALL